MTENEQKWVVDCFGIIPHPTETKILMRPNGQAYTLPHLAVPDANAFDGPKQVKAWVEEMLDGEARYLYCAYYRDFAEASRSEFVGVFENQHTASIQGIWVNR